MKKKALIAFVSFAAMISVNASPDASMSMLPTEIQQALLNLCHGCTFADSDAAWNKTDVINGLPQRHLKKVEKTIFGWIVEYDHGGRGLHSHRIVFALSPAVRVVEGSSCVPTQENGCEW